MKISQEENYMKQKRVMAYILRFIYSLKGIRTKVEHLTSEEIEEAEIKIIKLHQEHEWSAEIKQLKNS